MGAQVSGNLTFDGSSSTASQVSGVIGLESIVSNNRAFIIDVNVESGPFGITLQMKGDPTGETLVGWVDMGLTTIQVYDTISQSYLTQTDALIHSGIRRNGIVTASSIDMSLVLQFPVIPASYRLLFEIAATTVATVNYVVFT